MCLSFHPFLCNHNVVCCFVFGKPCFTFHHWCKLFWQNVWIVKQRVRKICQKKHAKNFCQESERPFLFFLRRNFFANNAKLFHTFLCGKRVCPSHSWWLQLSAHLPSNVISHVRTQLSFIENEPQCHERIKIPCEGPLWFVLLAVLQIQIWTLFNSFQLFQTERIS